MTTPQEQMLEVGGLAVRFTFVDDRYGHEVWLAKGSDWVRVLSSVEGTQADDWPPSPPLQSLQIEARSSEQRVVLLVGMAGQSHWSASVEADASMPRLRFDIACRVGSEHVGRLGSRYRAVWPLVSGDPRSARFMATRPHSRSVLIQADDRERDTCVERIADGAMVMPSRAVDLGVCRTVRWSYTITADNDSAATAP